jgi:hypothetical protein
MSLIDVLLGGARLKTNVLDYTHPNERFIIRRRVRQHIIDKYSVSGELFASISAGTPLKVFDGFRLEGKTYCYMKKSDWDEIDYQVRHPPTTPGEALDNVVKAMGLKKTP